MKFRRSALLLEAPLLLACGIHFYKAPPPLSAFPTRMPGQNWQDIMTQRHPMKADAAAPPEQLARCQELIAAFPALPAVERLSRTQELITANREGQFDSALATLLLEMEELAADDQAAQVCITYLRQRAGNLFSPGFNLRQKPKRTWSMKAEDFDQLTRKFTELRTGALLQADSDLAASSPSLLIPNFLVRHAAALMDAGEYERAEKEFGEVVRTFPGHPRAEVAAFMRGRCIFDDIRFNPFPSPEKLVKAREAFQQYLAAFPNGRLAPDAYGWLAAVSVKENDPGEAIRWQLKRLERRQSRETVRSVLRECGGIYDRLLLHSSKMDPRYATAYDEALAASLPWKEIAKVPEVAEVIISAAMDPAARDEFYQGQQVMNERDQPELAQMRLIRTAAFARKSMEFLGAAIEAAPAEEMTPFSSEILGWCALKSGQAERALAFFERASKSRPGSRVMHGRSLALAALNRHGEAADGFAAVTDAGPGTLVARSSEYYRITELFRGGRIAEAVANFPLEAVCDDSWGGPSLDDGVGLASLQERYPELHSIAEWTQLADSMLAFGDLQQLFDGLGKLAPEAPSTRVVRSQVRMRALAAGRFDLAEQCLEPAPPPDKTGDEFERRMAARAQAASVIPWQMDRDRWDREVIPLEELTQQLAKAKGKDVARLELALARRWQGLRGRLFAHGPYGFAGSETEKVEQIRRLNGVFFGYQPEQVATEIDSWDELVQALRHYLSAAEKSHDPEIAAPALEGANELLFRLAESSLYRRDRAIEEDHTALSAKLVHRLHKEFPQRPEALRAIAFHFRPMAKDEVWMPGDYSRGGSANLLLKSVYSPVDSFREESSSYYLYPMRDSAWVERHGRVKSEDTWIPSPASTMGSIQSDLAAARDRFAISHVLMPEPVIFRTGSRLDDLIAAAALPGMTPELYGSYYEYRCHREGQSPPNNPAWELLKPLVEYREFVSSIVQQSDSPSFDPAASWAGYLATHPGGLKTEAARFQWLRARVYGVTPEPYIAAFGLPESPIPNGYKRLQMYSPAQVTGLLAEAKRLRSQLESLEGIIQQAAQRIESLPEIQAATRPLIQSEIDGLEKRARVARDRLQRIEAMSPEERKRAEAQERADVCKDLETYERDYPRGRYHADYLVMRATLWADSGRCTEAIGDLSHLLKDNHYPELHMAAALRFAEICQRLLQPESRQEVFEALRKNPEALAILKNLVDGDTCLSRLKPMMEWVEQG